MSHPSYYVHQVSPFLFHVNDLQASWFTQGPVAWVLWPLYAAIVGAGFLGGRIPALAKLAPAARSAVTTGTIGVAACFLLQALHVDWGLRWYSTMYLLGFVFAYVVFRSWIRTRSVMMTPALLDSFFGYFIAGMLIGARAAYVLIYNWEDTLRHPWEVFAIWMGGLSFHGGIVGVCVALWLFCRKNKIPFLHLLDKVSRVVPFGVAMGRIGNFMNGELYGRIVDSDVPWAMVFPSGGPQPRHPSQLYQSLCEGWGLLLTLYIFSRWKHREGTMTAAAVFFYSLYRYAMEFFREPDEQLKFYFGNTTTMGQILCGLGMLAALGLFWWSRRGIREASPAWQKRTDTFLAELSAEGRGAA